MPDPKNLWKELETFVIYSESNGISKTSPLSELAGDNLLAYMNPTTRVIINRIVQQRRLLMDKYKNLWRVSLFLSPKINLNENAYCEIPELASEIIEKALHLYGVEVKPLTSSTLITPSELNDIIISLQFEARDIKELEDLLNI